MSSIAFIHIVQGITIEHINLSDDTIAKKKISFAKILKTGFLDPIKTSSPAGRKHKKNQKTNPKFFTERSEIYQTIQKKRKSYVFSDLTENAKLHDLLLIERPYKWDNYSKKITSYDASTGQTFSIKKNHIFSISNILVLFVPIRL